MAEASLDQQRVAARHLLQHPLTCAEREPELFTLIRRHEAELDRWFTQRLGYRLHVTSSTARLFKTTVVPHRRPLRAATASKRPLTQREYTMLTLLLAAVASGPRVVSLHDLVDDVRTAAADAEVTLTEEPVDRRALVTALKWMMDAGLAIELHERIDRYIDDVSADAVVEVDPDRVGLVPLPVLGRAETPAQLLDRSDRRAAARQWMRARLVEDPVLYRDDLDDAEWAELRRRFGEEDAWLDEMFGLRIEARAEGVAAIDPDAKLSDRTFPTSATTGHAALLFVAQLAEHNEPVTRERALKMMKRLARSHRNLWSRQSVDDPAGLLRAVLDLLADNRLVEIVESGNHHGNGNGNGNADADNDANAAVGDISVGNAVVDDTVRSAGPLVRVLPAAARFIVAVEEKAPRDAKRRPRLRSEPAADRLF